MALHPGHPGVGPCLSTFSRYIFQFRVNCRSSCLGCGVGRSSSGGDAAWRLEYAGMRRPACPGTGWLGLPFISATLCLDHLSSSGFLITEWALNTPTLVPIRCSAVRISKPNHNPSLHLSSYLPAASWVFGILKCTVSPNSAILDIGFRPWIRCMAVLPSAFTLHLEMRHAACLTSHSTICARTWIFVPMRSSSADRIVLTCACTS